MIEKHSGIVHAKWLESLNSEDIICKKTNMNIPNLINKFFLYK